MSLNTIFVNAGPKCKAGEKWSKSKNKCKPDKKKGKCKPGEKWSKSKNKCKPDKKGKGSEKYHSNKSGGKVKGGGIGGLICCLICCCCCLPVIIFFMCFAKGGKRGSGSGS